MSYDFCIAELSDCDGVAALVNSVYRGEASMQSWTTEAHLVSGARITREQVAELIGDRQQVIWLAKRNNRIVGCVNLKRLNGKGYLGMLSVDLSEQKSGLGSQLVKLSENYVYTEWACKKMIMWVLSVRKELLDWYNRKGYRYTDERIPYSALNDKVGTPMVDDLEFIVLEKDLSDTFTDP